MALVKKGMPIWFKFGKSEDLETGQVTELVWRRKLCSAKQYILLKPGVKRKYKKARSGMYYRTYPFTIVEMSNTKEKFAILFFSLSKPTLLGKFDFLK